MDVPNATAIDSSKTALLSGSPGNCAKPVAISAPAPRHVRSRAQPKSTRCCGAVVSQCPVDQSPRLPLSRLRPVCAQLEQSVWSCPSWLRIIPSTPKSGNMPSYYTIMRGRCRDSHTSTTSWRLWDFCGYASGFTTSGHTEVLCHLSPRPTWSRPSSSVNAPLTLSPSRDARNAPIAPSVNMTRIIPTHCRQDDQIRCRRPTVAPGR